MARGVAGRSAAAFSRLNSLEDNPILSKAAGVACRISSSVLSPTFRSSAYRSYAGRAVGVRFHIMPMERENDKISADLHPMLDQDSRQCGLRHIEVAAG